MTERKISFAEATRTYVHRYTMEHVPSWARKPAPNGKYYAPPYRTDREWYNNTYFEGESELASREYCYSTNESWPLGKWLDSPYKAGD